MYVYIYLYFFYVLFIRGVSPLPWSKSRDKSVSSFNAMRCDAMRYEGRGMRSPQAADSGSRLVLMGQWVDSMAPELGWKKQGMRM